MEGYIDENRWIDLSVLPKRDGTGWIDWKHCIGIHMAFQYEEVQGFIRVVDYDYGGLLITIDKYVVEPYRISVQALRDCYIHHLVANKIVDKAPHLIVYLKNKNDAYKYSYGCSEFVDVVCPICGNEFKQRVNDLYFRGIRCHACSDNISLPNKMMFNVLKQIGINFIFEPNRRHGFEWMQRYRYDFYFKIENQEYLIEMDGGFHKTNTQQKTDKIKDKLAIDNHMILVRIDCDYRGGNPIKFIQENIMKSYLCKILPFENVDWNKCAQQSMENLITKVCDIWTSSDLCVSEISKKLLLSTGTVRKYLSYGNQIGICPSYNHDEIRRRDSLVKQKPVALMYANQIKYVFKGAKEVEEKSLYLFRKTLKASQVNKVCGKDRLQTCNGFIFQYISNQTYDIYKDTLNQQVSCGELGQYVTIRIQNSTPIALVDDNNEILCVFKSLEDCRRKMEKLYGETYSAKEISKTCKNIRNTYKNKRFIYITYEEYENFINVQRLTLMKGDESI